ncbi:hypothetical protein COCCADRAFT_92390 [Bipolaris zeicola 26-R-13]|uniref:Uncharacterized protein n=1 Tax=Cochliobolus carbonum (strain 26-R-13) TaxID=930089 RepID=W6Y5S1_COCC2|nr:uncharacterized protein COCCADRAFT_92390 [Bipolaris zeicola 26-R-13]EUC34872.1 hypothetical protein COCCADRAFT_92390 [Bipolaris zeicola 26-R-13]
MIAAFPNGVVIVFAFSEVGTCTDRYSGAVLSIPSIFVPGPKHACSLHRPQNVTRRRHTSG